MRLSSLFIILLLATAAIGQDAKIESPYFITEGIAPGAFPLQSTDVDVSITGPIANVVVRQVYHNHDDQPIEATYVFPASTRAAVHGMTMRIGDRVVEAEIKEKQAARKTYTDAKEAGKRTSLLEQHESNVFQMSVANILPGESIEIELRYTEFLLFEDQQYSFVYPTVVGPRYTGEQAAEYAAQPYTKAGVASTSTFDIDVDITMPIPVYNISSRAHAVSVVRLTDRDYQIHLDHSDGYAGNRDYILNYSLAGDEAIAGAITTSFGGENFFLCQVEAPEVCEERQIVPREYIFIVDVSGSMGGFPLTVSKELMRNLLTGLKQTDHFNILFFAGGNWMLSPQSLPATQRNIDDAIAAVDKQSGGGGTNMLQAIKRSMAEPKQAGTSRSFVIVTDGYVSIDRTAMDYVRDHLGTANFFAFGIGSSVNRQLIEGLAHVGNAKPFVVTEPSAASAVAQKLHKYINEPVLTDIRISSNAPLYDLAFDHIPDLMAGRPIYFFGKYKGDKVPTFEVTGNQGNVSFTQRVSAPLATSTATVLPYLWARETIKYLDDYTAVASYTADKQKVIDIGLAYNLLTRYTSFVAVDEEVVTDGNPKTKAQPLPLPKGVGNAAIGVSNAAYSGVGFAMEVEDHLLGSVRLDIHILDDNGKRIYSLEHILEAILLKSPALSKYLSTGRHRLTIGQPLDCDPLLEILSQELLALGLVQLDDSFVIDIKRVTHE
jgi:Ca-activated chloride channel family protein